jgi:hypothetical protein
MTAEQVAQTAEIAFVGEVTAIEESSFRPLDYCWSKKKEQPQCGGKKVTFRVTERIRGNLENVVTAVAEDACYCLGIYWSPKMQYLVVAKPDPKLVRGPLVVSNGCSGTMTADGEAKEFIKALRAVAR